jgi:hypothetical protein
VSAKGAGAAAESSHGGAGGAAKGDSRRSSSREEAEEVDGNGARGEQGEGGGKNGEQAWVPCMPPPIRNPANNSATISFATGPEDPRLQFSELDGVC